VLHSNMQSCVVLRCVTDYAKPGHAMICSAILCYAQKVPLTSKSTFLRTSKFPKRQYYSMRSPFAMSPVQNSRSGGKHTPSFGL